MKTTDCTLRTGLLLTILALALALPPAARADATRSYNRSSSIETSHPDWMRWVPDSTLLSDLSIPGTHDTMALYGGDLVETQSLTLRRQLNAGIRVLDIRCRHIEDVFAIHHGVVFQNAYFGTDVLKVCYEFLRDNPTETILMRVGDAGVPDEQDCTRDYDETFQWYRDNTTYGSCIFIDPAGYDTIHTLGAVRGKVVILDEFDGGNYGYNLFGDNTDLLDMQAEYDLNTIYDRDNKWNIVKDFFQYTDGDTATWTEWGEHGTVHHRPAESGRFYINWTSATSFNGGVYPNAIATYINPRVLEYLFDRNQNRTTGIVWMDFPGAALIDAIIAHNLKFATNASDRATFQASFNNVFNNVGYALAHEDYDDYGAGQRAAVLQQFLNHILPFRGAGFSVQDHWSVVVSGVQGGENWGVATTSDGLFKQSEWIDGYSAVAMNAVNLATSVTTNQLQTYLGFPLLNAQLATILDAEPDCIQRASKLKSLLRTQFPGVNWNVAVSQGHALGISAKTACYATAPYGLYFYTAWAGSKYELAPIPNAGGPYVVNEGNTLTLDASGTTDPDNGVLTYRWDFDNNGTWDATNSSPKISRLYSNQGNHTVRLQVSDGENTAETTTTVTVNNVAPSLNLGANTGVALGDSFNRSCFFKDPGSDSWTVTVDYGDGTPPVNVSHINKNFQLAKAYPTSGTRTVTVSVNDGTATGQDSIQVTVAPGGTPMLNSFTGPSGPVEEGTTVTVNAGFYYGVWDQPVTLSWGDGSPDTQPTVLPAGGGNYTFTAQHIYPNIPPGSTNNYIVTATWPDWITSTLPITVVDGPPTFSSLTVPSSVPEGTLVQVGYTIVAPSADTLTQEVDWGDGARQSWVGGPRTSVSPPHTYTSPGTNTITMRVTDNELSTSTDTRTIIITDAVPQITEFYPTGGPGLEGSPASVRGLFSSPNLANDQFTVQINWGDGSPATTAAYQSVGGNFAMFNAAHVYQNNNGLNPWTVTATVTDHSGSVATTNLTVSITNVPPVVDVVPNFSILDGFALARSGHITDPGSDTFTGTVNYGDGTGTQPLSITGNSYQLNHTYPSNAVYTITVNVTDQDGASSNRTMKVLVGPVRDLLVSNTNNAGPGSLRQAVLEANTPSVNSASFTNAYADIRFAPALSGQTITLTSGQLLSSLRTRILATNLPAGIQISGNDASRILEVASNNWVVLDSLTIKEGRVTGGIPNSGGGVLSFGNLIMNRCTLSTNRSDISGGGLFVSASGSATLNECTLMGNQSLNSVGGAISSSGKLTLNQCTVSGNSAGANGGGIVSSFGTLTLNHCTVSSNSSFSPSGLSVANGVSCTVANSIIAGNSGNSIGGTVTYLGTNLTSGNPMLYPLGYYGGPTPTMPPRSYSPAIDAIANVSLALPTTPLAYWRLGEEDAGATNGQSTLITSNRLNAPLKFNAPVTYTGAVSPIAAGWSDSRLGLTFTPGTYGTNGLITGLDGSTAITDNFGIELWVKPSALSGNQCLAYNGNTGGAGSGGWGLYLIGNQYYGLFGGVDLIGSATASAGVWTHLALVRNNGTATLYVNGVASGTSAATPGVPLGRCAVGAQPQTLAAEFFAGALDEVRVFTFAPGQFAPESLSYQPTPSVGYSLPPTQGESGLDSAWSLDQRGYPRVANGAADIGAVEVQQSIVRVTDDAGNGSLRQVLTDVDNLGIVTFAPALSGQTITLTSGQLTLAQSVTVDASSLPGGIQISGNHSSRVFDVVSGAVVFLDSLTIKNGSSSSPNGAGGGIRNNGTLTVNRSTIVGNSSASGYNGGGIGNPGGNLVLNQCTITGNSSPGNGAGLSSTLSAVVNQCTISDNSAGNAGGGVHLNGGTITISNSIVAGNTATVGGTANLSGNVTIVGPNVTTGNPLLAPLGNYGGPTPTMPLLPGSPAIDGCTGGTSFLADQRGQPRIISTHADIGAVEGVFNAAFPLFDVTAPGSGNVQFSFNNLSGLSFTVLASTNVAAPLNTWVNLGPVVEASPGTFLFTDLQATNYPQRFYKVQGP
ncbi:MAG TPA: phosphatidylinositol-specific phospholipase C domain-containing protein [Verrucomicrobiae bacterium]|nr:phosphatidylinositol-specific phospholipase C domain-containing protein [Verrucomicrobiae bacterium]